MLVGCSCLASGAPVTGNNDSGHLGVGGATANSGLLGKREADDPCAARRWFGCKLVTEKNERVDKQGRILT